MKLKILLLIVLPLLPGNAFAGLVSVNKNNGGAHGWEKVVEDHIGGNSSLTCSDPGNNACAWKNAPNLIAPDGSKHDFSTEIEPVVDANISKGILSGSYIFETNYTVSWKATDIYNYQIDVDIVD